MSLDSKDSCARKLSGERGASIITTLIIVLVLGVAGFFLFNPVKNRVNAQVCKQKLSVIRTLQEKFFSTTGYYAEHPDDLKAMKNYPELEPSCIRTGQELEYFRGPRDDANYWEISVTVAGEWENQCFVTANRSGVFAQGVCATKKDLKKAAEAESQSEGY
jgi:hypothetical protein